MAELDQRATDLPAVDRIRAQARDDRGRHLVVVAFENGARLQYRRTNAGVREEWVGPDADDPIRAHLKDADGGPKALALEAVGTYLSFDDRARAEFVWGAANVATVLGEGG